MTSPRALRQLGLATLVWALATSVASAGLINLSSRDLLSAGDGLLTYDASTGLEWLDLTYTAGQSIESGEALPFFDAAATNGRFRWATSAEILDLLHEIPVAANLAPAEWLIDYTPAGIADARAFIQLLGDTYGQPQDPVALGVSRGIPDLPNHAFGLSFVEGTDFGGDFQESAQIVAPDGSCCMSAQDSSPVVGLWLVRPASSVPEQVTSALLALGLLRVGIRRVRARKA